MKLATITLIFSYFFASHVFAGWSSVNKIDEFTDQQVRFAVYIDDAHRIQISYEGTDVWMFITKRTAGTFEPNSIIELRVDKNKTYMVRPDVLKRLENIGKKAYQWEPATVGFLIWHGKENEGCHMIEQLMGGKQLKGRYQLNSLERETFTISLAGAKQALIVGLGLKICGIK